MQSAHDYIAIVNIFHHIRRDVTIAVQVVITGLKNNRGLLGLRSKYVSAKEGRSTHNIDHQRKGVFCRKSNNLAV